MPIRPQCTCQSWEKDLKAQGATIFTHGYLADSRDDLNRESYHIRPEVVEVI